MTSSVSGRSCGVVGDPIAHSLSPVLHRAAYATCGLDWTYDAHQVPAGSLAGFVAGLDARWRGLSVTAPLKREALELCTTVSPLARQAGGVNTLVLADGEVSGDNTDVPGAVAAMRRAGIDAVESAAILGGGATATSTGLALAELGATRIALLVRTPERAAETRAALAETGAVVQVLPLTEPISAQVLVSTIPASAQDSDLLDRAGSAEAVFEVLYAPWPTPLAAAATARSQTLVGGLDLLIAQAALQFTAFTGLPAPVDAMRVAGERALGMTTG